MKWIILFILLAACAPAETIYTEPPTIETDYAEPLGVFPETPDGRPVSFVTINMGFSEKEFSQTVHNQKELNELGIISKEYDFKDKMMVIVSTQGLTKIDRINELEDSIEIYVDKGEGGLKYHLVQTEIISKPVVVIN